MVTWCFTPSQPVRLYRGVGEGAVGGVGGEGTENLFFKEEEEKEERKKKKKEEEKKWCKVIHRTGAFSDFCGT